MGEHPINRYVDQTKSGTSLVGSESSSDITASEDEATWIAWYCGLRGNDFFCEVDEEYIQDYFNLSGLSTMVGKCYEHSLDLILDIDIPLDKMSEAQQEIVESGAELLYGLIHARFILTPRGMQRMYEKYQNIGFGRCPRVYCQGQPVLPVGLSDIPRCYGVNVYCPCCQDIYHPKSTKQANLDGAFFGTTFSHLFLLTNPDLVINRHSETYVPRIYGFRINKNSQYYSRGRENGAKASKRRGSPPGSASSVTPTSAAVASASPSKSKTVGGVGVEGGLESIIADSLEQAMVTKMRITGGAEEEEEEEDEEEIEGEGGDGGVGRDEELVVADIDGPQK